MADPLKAHVNGFAEYDFDLRAFMEDVVMPLTPGGSSPLALAHSMGAHILLQALHADRRMFAAAVLIAPMLRLETSGYPGSLVRALSSAHERLGLSRDWVWGMQLRDPLRLRFEDNRVTSDRGRLRARKAFSRQIPHCG